MSKAVKVIISGYIGFDNFGDEAILSVLLEDLKAQSTDITVISSNPDKTKLIHGVKTVKTFDILSILFNLAKTDVFISGGGSLLQDKTSIKSLMYYLFLIFAAKIFGKKIIIFAQGIGPINNPLARILTKIAIKSAALVSVRDEKSLFLMRGWGIDTDLQPDPVFNLELPDYSPMGHVGIQLRSWKYLSENFLSQLSKAILDNFSDREILLFSLQDSLDYEVCKAFQTRLIVKNPKIKTRIVLNNYPNSIPENLKTLEYLIAMRFHACLAALKMGVKTLALNYDEKVEKLAKEAEIPFVNLDEADKISEKIEALKSLKTSMLYEYANSRKYDFTKINNLIKQLEN